MTGGGGNVKARDTQAFREDEPLPSTSRPHTTNVVSVRPLSNARRGISRPIGHIAFVRTYRAARHIALPQAKYRVPSGTYRARQGISQRCHSAQLAIWRSQVKRRISYNQARDKGFFISHTLHSE